MRNSSLTSLFILVFVSVYGQRQFELSCNIGLNATTARILKTNNNTWGYTNPAYPNGVNITVGAGYGTKRDMLALTYSFGHLSLNEKIDNYADKFPKQSHLEPNEFNPDNTHILSYTRNDVQLNHISLEHKHKWTGTKKFNHNTIVGIGLSWQNGYRSHFQKDIIDFDVPDTSINGSYVNENIGYAANDFYEDIYAHLRSTNFYLTVGYELSYSFSDRWHWNTRLSYNQGLFKMIKWHTYRLYTESLTDYTEFDEQWSYTRLSYFALTTGVSYRFGGRKDD